jgi:TPR repeat protein
MMRMTAEIFARGTLAEAREDRVVRLNSMNRCELRVLLGGDPAHAAPWVQSAAEYGLPAAQLRLGRMLLEGQGLVRDQDLAVFWFTRSAQQGDADAMNMAGRCFENGWGTRVNLETAAHWYGLSASGAHDWGQYNFGNMLLDGRGIRLDRQQALHWYRQAARQGHSRAMNLMGRCAEEGWGCPKNPAVAFEAYRLSAAHGYFRGQFNYAAALAERGHRSEAARWFWECATSATDDVRNTIVTLLAEASEPSLKHTRMRVTKLLHARAREYVQIVNSSSQKPPMVRA